MDRRRHPLVLLEKEKLAEINEELRLCSFSCATWFELGLSLGLSLQTLETIEANHRGNTSRCLMTALDKWLSRADNVTGPLSWMTLADGLRRIGETSAFEKISKLCDPASQLFQCYSVRLSAVFISEESVDLLCTKRLISNETRTGVESVGGFLLGDTLREIRTSITEDHNKLRALGDILLKSDETKTIGQDILKECDELFLPKSDDHPVPPSVTNNGIAVPKCIPSGEIAVTTAVVRPVNSSAVNQLPTAASAGEFFFNAAYKPVFNEIRGSFGSLRVKIVPLLAQSIPSVAELKLYLQLSFPELSAELSNADSIEAIMNVVLKSCRVNDLSLIKATIKHFKITEAKPIISEYEEEVKTVCRSLKDFICKNQPEHFLISETIQFTLGWEPDKHSLDDIRDVLEEAFKELNKRIIVQSFNRGNSIIIICYGPHHLLAALLLEAQDNLTVLMKEFSLIRLTIGHYTVYDRDKRMNNEGFAEEITLSDGEEQELRTLLDYKEGSIFEKDKQLNIIKKRKELKLKLLTREKFTNEKFKSKKLEADYFRFQTSLMKAGIEEALEYKKEIELLQENISTTSVQLLMSQKAVIHKKNQYVQSLVSESGYIALCNYNAIWSGDLSFSEQEQLAILSKSGYWWRGRSLVSGDEGVIPSSCVYSMLESLQLLEFILSVEEISLPILQKIRNDSSSNDEKASLFLETINDDPIMISALREDKEQFEKGHSGKVDWHSDTVSLSFPSPAHCNEVINNINHEEIELHFSSTNSTVSVLSSTKLYTLNLRRLVIQYTPLTNDCIQYLCTLLTNNKTMQELVIVYHSISDKGVTNICQTLEHNSTLAKLYLHGNPLVTSTSGRALSHLLCNNSSLVELDLKSTSLSTESISLILKTLLNKNKTTKIKFDKRHKESCMKTNPNYHLIEHRVSWY